MDTCLNCGGAIGEPGKAYGYAGKWCYCPVLQGQRPASHEQRLDMQRAPQMDELKKLHEKSLEAEKILQDEGVTTFNTSTHFLNSVKGELDALNTRIKGLTKALEFYAHGATVIGYDGGDAAKEALEKFGEKK